MESKDAESELKITKADKKNFKEITEFIIEKFGLEPLWKIHVSIDPDELNPDALAKSEWNTDYRDAFLVSRWEVVSDRRMWRSALIHEMTHLLLHRCSDYMFESAGKNVPTIKGLIEATTSETSNVIEQFFIGVHGKEMEQWY